jgi:hypothetical protein
MSRKDKPAIDDLRVWWIPQVPMKPFYVSVNSINEALLLVDTLGRYDAFQLENNVKGDYANAGGLQIYEAGSGKRASGWSDWYDPETGDDIDDLRLALRVEA